MTPSILLQGQEVEDYGLWLRAVTEHTISSREKKAIDYITADLGTFGFS